MKSPSLLSPEKFSLSAFTLAEVLITLGIIGIVAAMTIPAIIQNTNEKELIVAWKKAYSSITTAYNQAVMDNGGNIGDTNICSAGQLDRIKELQKYLRVTKICNSNNSLGNCWAKNGVEPDSAVVESPGSPKLSRQNVWYSFSTADGMYFMPWNGCSILYVDVNGEKGPNIWGKDVHGMVLNSNGKINNLGYGLSTDQNATTYLSK